MLKAYKILSPTSLHFNISILFTFSFCLLVIMGIHEIMHHYEEMVQKFILITNHPAEEHCLAE